MKKNIAMRVAAFLFILTMISTCAFATTFAKYVTDGTATDSARVAKWGVEVTVTGNDAFKTDYATDDSTYTGTNSVSAKAVADVDTRESLVAPGTNGTLCTYQIAGTPEVAANVSVVFTFDLGNNWNAEGYYCPLVITVGKTEISGLTYDSAEAFEDAVIAAVVANYNVAANESLAKTVTVSWAWEFEGNDAKDTILGSADAAPTIKFGITVTVTQID